MGTELLTAPSHSPTTMLGIYLEADPLCLAPQEGVLRAKGSQEIPGHRPSGPGVGMILH